MKKLTTLSLSLLFIFSGFAQQKTRTYDDYMQKSSKRLTGAFIFLGTGAALTAGGTALIISGANDDDDSFDETGWEGKVIGGAVMMVGGIMLMGTSIPFFIMSHRYKKKAMNLAFKTEKIQLPRIGKPGNQYYPAIALKISIGK